jgi:peptidoglycan DL-endopeptidase CwlO
LLSPIPARTRLSALALLLVTLFGSVAVAAPAEAAPVSTRVLAEAKKHKGKPYKWGASGPRRFDCSGYTMYVFRKATGKRLPHSSRAQYRVTKHIGKQNKRVGDLLFFYSRSGRIRHVAIYAGNNKMWHSPRSGSTVKLVRVYSSRYKVGRVV